MPLTEIQKGIKRLIRALKAREHIACIFGLLFFSDAGEKGGELMNRCVAQPINNSHDHLVKKHPCFNREAHAKFGRIHLLVSPSCNIQCRFCRQGFNK